MRIRNLVFVSVCLFPIAAAQGVVIVDDNFNSYANATAFTTAWPADLGNGISPTTGPIGIITPCILGDPCPPAPFDGTGDANTLPPVAPLTSQAIAFNTFGAINEWDNDNNTSTVPFSAAPSATQNVRLTADIFDDAKTYPQGPAGRRFSVGLRNDTIDREPNTAGFQAGMNLIELGVWNGPVTDPTTPNPPLPLPATDLAHRVVLFGAPSAPLLRNPDWQYFRLPIEFDSPTIDHNGDGRFGDGDGIPEGVEVGPGWHRYSAEISLTAVTMSLDLFRDGVVDSTVTYPIVMLQDPLNPGTLAPFTSLRMGGPSGVTMNQFTMVDNVLLELVDLMTTPDGDFDNDGDYDCDDINALTTAVATGGTVATFDLNGDSMLSVSDMDAWRLEAGEDRFGSGRPYLVADANLDGFVDGTDFGVWNGGKFSNNTNWCSGNFNGDLVIDGSDFGLWNGNKFTASDAGGLVPEPVSLTGWIGFGLLMGACAYRRKHR